MFRPKGTDEVEDSRRDTASCLVDVGEPPWGAVVGGRGCVVRVWFRLNGWLGHRRLGCQGMFSAEKYGVVIGRQGGRTAGETL